MLKADTSSKTVTPTQIKFLRLLHERGPLTVKEMSSTLAKSIQYAHQTIRALLEDGIVEKTFEGIDTSTERNLSWEYKLSVPIESINIKPRHLPYRIPDTELLYAAILRNGGMTGRELQDQFRAKYPHRSVGSLLSSIIPRARQKKWEEEDGSEKKWCR